jgi:uncharacterized protein
MSLDLTLAELSLYVAATFAASFVAGLAGFAFGLVAAAIWLHMLTPLQATTLIVAYGLIVQGHAVWKLRHALELRRLMPLLIGSQAGIPIGIELLRFVPAEQMRGAIGLALVAFSLHSLLQSRVRLSRDVGVLAESGVGVAGGIVGGASGLAGIVPTIWVGLLGLSKERQRAVFQPVAVATFAGSALWLGGTGAVDTDTTILFAVGLPAVLAGSSLGLRYFGRLGESGFRRIVLVLLLLAGISLIAPLLQTS